MDTGYENEFMYRTFAERHNYVLLRSHITAREPAILPPQAKADGFSLRRVLTRITDATVRKPARPPEAAAERPRIRVAD